MNTAIICKSNPCHSSSRPDFPRWLIATFIAACSAHSVPGNAIDLNAGGLDLTFHGGLTYGTTIRTDNRDSALIQRGNGSRVGVTGTAVGGSNTDDGELNFNKGDTVSTVAKAVGSVDLRRGKYGVAARAKLWHELTLGDSNPAFGNLPNGYSANHPLRDTGFSERAKFSGAVLQDVYVYGSFEPWDKPLALRLGQQFLPWGSGWTITGGISALNPVDLPAVRRAGALPEEMLVPIPALYGKLALDESTALEGFYQFRFRPTALDGCGTFFSTYDYLAPGCNGVVVVPSSAISDRTAVSAGLLAKRAPTPDVSDSGEFGLSLTRKIPELDTDFGILLAEYHSRLPVASAIKTARVIPPFPFLPNDPDGKNPLYFTEYPERIRMLGLTFSTKRDDLTIAGELTYRPNQPVVFNATELLRAFVSNTAPTTLRADGTATPLGGVFHGYDRRKVTQAQLSVSNKFHSLLGAEEAMLAAEAGLKYMNDLPDQATRRYGRQDAFGVGPVNGVCEPGSAAIQCSQEGYVSRRAWGYRLRAGLRYPNIIDQVDFTPAMTFTHDVRGWSYDNGFNEGRRTLGMSLRATYRKMYFGDVTWTPTWGGYFNNARDRSWLAAAAGLRF
ncbi:conserved protein of unknown function [Georgfuchsia toluolica]|uniref:DUF1302 domain-containing protein n=1 Tax=Georgfuchsia toluolica TaxID=424218 RepID=A0A916J4D6_9PROT|nr:conserved protein of unknown function [Georgfuchsia toluolica]